jgi:menaquinone-dependent protoporphyrinogen oxidase
MASVIVAYASAHHSTEEIAGHIASRVTACGNQVDLKQVDDVVDVARYDRVVLGSAVHDQRWLPEALDFVERNRAELTRVPLWAFSVGMTGALPRWMRRGATLREEAKIRASTLESLHPLGHRLFSGVVRAEDLPPLGRFLIRSAGGRFGDFRDWAEIDRWADEITASIAVDG